MGNLLERCIDIDSIERSPNVCPQEDLLNGIQLGVADHVPFNDQGVTAR